MMSGYLTWRVTAGLLTVVALATMIGCTTTASVPDADDEEATAPHVQIGKHDPEDLAAKLMGFADAYASKITRSHDDLEQRTDDPKVRNWCHQEKLNTVRRTYIIATGANPAVALLDMVASVQLMRINMEEKIIPEILGDEGKDILDAHRKSEEEVWDIAGDILTVEQQGELRKLIQKYWEDNKGFRYVGFARFDDLAAYRETTEGPSGLLDLIGLDPVAGLEPMTWEVHSSRLLAERFLFYVERAPTLISWQVENLLSEQSESIADLIAEKVATERENIMRDLEDQESKLRDLSQDVRETMVAANDFALSFNNTILSFDMLVSRFKKNGSKESNPSGSTDEAESDTSVSQTNANTKKKKPFDITEYTETAIELSETSRDLNELVISVDSLLNSPVLNQEESPLGPTISEAENSAERLLNLAFKYILTIVLVILIGIPTVMFIYRYVCHRLTGSRRAVSGD